MICVNHTRQFFFYEITAFMAQRKRPTDRQTQIRHTAQFSDAAELCGIAINKLEFIYSFLIGKNI